MFRRGHKDITPFRVDSSDGFTFLVTTPYKEVSHPPQNCALILDEVGLHVVDGDALHVFVKVANEDAVLEALHKLLLAGNGVTATFLAVTIAVQTCVAAHDQLVLVSEATAARLGA